MTTLPEWMRPPREEGWFADDLDDLSEAPRHTELIDGYLVFRLAPQQSQHDWLVAALAAALMDQVPDATEVKREVTIRLDSRNRPEPDLLVSTTLYGPDRTWCAPEDVLVVIEVVSSESAPRDRTVKLRKYAEAGIRHYWCIEDEDGAPVVHVYELDEPTHAYVATGIFRGSLHRLVPFEINLDLDKLSPPRRA